MMYDVMTLSVNDAFIYYKIVILLNADVKLLKLLIEHNIC